MADVRSVPYSRLHPHFNKATLAKLLKEQLIAYGFIGKELGGRSDDPACYENGRVQYRRLSRTDLFRNGINRIIDGSYDNRIALMCAEREPLECHRAILVGRELSASGVQVAHILADGHIELHDQALDRLRHLLRLPVRDLFRSDSEVLEEAYSRQENRIAFVNKDLPRSAPPTS